MTGKDLEATKLLVKSLSLALDMTREIQLVIDKYMRQIKQCNEEALKLLRKESHVNGDEEA
jgi:hypothetical protein